MRGAIFTCLTSPPETGRGSSELCCKTLLPGQEAGQAPWAILGLQKWNDAEKRQPQLLDLAGASQRLHGELQHQGNEEPKNEPGCGASGNQLETVWRIRVVGQICRLDQRQAFSPLLGRHASAVLCLQKILRYLLVLITKCI